MAVLSKTAASLRVCGDTVEPDEITKLLGIDPTHAHVKGQISFGKNTGKKRISKTGVWRLKAEAREPGDINGQIFELIDKTTKDLETWKLISSKYSLDLFCGFFMESGNEGIEISPKAMKALGDRNIELAIDLYGE